MNADEIIHMALEAEFDCSDGHVYHPDTTDPLPLDKFIERFATLVAEQERAEWDGLRKVAQMALEWFDWLNAPNGPISPPHIAKDVRNALRKELSE